jgi:hypothetical protein
VAGPFHPGEVQLNAWYCKCSIKGAPSGKLAGKKGAPAVEALPPTVNADARWMTP